MRISLKKQRIIKFVPIVQFITLFCWVGCCRRNKISLKESFRHGLMILMFMLLINIPRLILHFVFHNDILDNIIFYISIYPTFFGMASIAVVAQEKYDMNF